MDEENNENLKMEKEEPPYSVFLKKKDDIERESENILVYEYTECALISVIPAVLSVLPLLFPEFVRSIMETTEKIYESGVTDIIRSGIKELTGMVNI